MNSAAEQGAVLRLPTDQIDPDGLERIGFFYPAEAEALADVIASDGQQEPIMIAPPAPRAKDRRYRLVYGRHRLAACAALGVEVLARVVSGSNDELLRMQTAEQIDRRDMTVLERAAFVGRRAEIVRERALKAAGVESDKALGTLWTNLSKASKVELTPAQEALLAKAPKSEQVAPPTSPQPPKEEVAADVSAVGGHYGWRAEVAEEFGLHFKKMDRLLTIYRALIKPFRAEVEAIAHCRIASNADALLQLAAKNEPVRQAALKWLAQNPEAKTAEEALVALGFSTSKGLRAADQLEGESKLLTRATSNLERLTPSTWISFAPSLAGMIKPSALSAVRDAIDARIAEIEGKR
ncbi:ParB N-terminal domain-containing protein [Novosphingobium sp. NDB2Meth1]|uniref:ParB N-terminal domain-containing protein n=1 Tax=Novosphingobium sp. NDB2Meth1 TaxID=1892847 RepID=UPI000931FACC|nr:ParB N-terminal domain-containing protein [Novosphingobium sp. NDB2Meth1]